MINSIIFDYSKTIFCLIRNFLCFNVWVLGSKNVSSEVMKIHSVLDSGPYEQASQIQRLQLRDQKLGTSTSDPRNFRKNSETHERLTF